MRNNPYKAMIKVLTPKKNDRLIIQRKGDDVYMSETHVAFKVRYSLYESWIHGEKPTVFPIIEDGQCISNGEPCDMDISRCMDEHDKARYDATPTNLIKEIKDASARLVLIYESASGNYVPMLINNEFYKAVEPFINDYDCKVSACGSQVYPLWIECDALTALLLPIRDADYIRESKACGKALATLAGIDIYTCKSVA